MALIFCPECGNQVSEKAEQCNKCSYPINKINVQGNETQANEMRPFKSETYGDEKSNKKAEMYIFLFLSFLLARFFVWFLMQKGYISSQNKPFGLALVALYIFPPILLGYAIRQITGNIIGIILALVFIILSIYANYEVLHQLFISHSNFE